MVIAQKISPGHPLFVGIMESCMPLLRHVPSFASPLGLYARNGHYPVRCRPRCAPQRYVVGASRSRCRRIPQACVDPLSTPEMPIDEHLLEDDPLIVDLSEETQKTKKVRRRTGNLVSEIDREEPVEDSIDPTLLPPVHLDEVADYARTAVRAADKRKAESPVAFRVANVSYITTFMVCLTGKSTPQIRAIANIVEEELLKQHQLKPKQSTRTTSSGWILLDYGDLMVHIFSPEQRVNYNMESLWRKGEPLDISDCVTGSSEGAEKPVQSITSDPVDDDDDWL